MIKAWRCSGFPGRTFPGVCFYKHEVGDQIKCAITEGVAPLCDVEPVAVTPLAEHEKVQAALAAAEEALQPFGTWLHDGDTDEDKAANVGRANIALTKIREIRAVTKIRRSNG